MDKYKDYTIEDLVVEESFINWVKESNVRDIDFWNNWLKANESETKKVMSAKKLVEDLRFKEKDGSSIKEDALWDKISNQVGEEKISSDSESATTTRRSILPWIGVAASVLLLAFFFFPSGDKEVSLNTTLAEIQNVDLPEGSSVVLNSESRLSYNKKAFGENRILKLTGEAFFKVKRGSSFKVQTPHGTVEVLGTSFNVYSRDSIFSVECKTGKVAVTSTQKKTILEKNQAVKIRTNQPHEKTEDLRSLRSSWQEGIYSYQEEGLSSIVADMERHMGVKITLQSEQENLMFTGSFNSSSLETALSEVCWPLGLEYEIKGKTVLIDKK